MMGIDNGGELGIDFEVVHNRNLARDGGAGLCRRGSAGGQGLKNCDAVGICRE